MYIVQPIKRKRKNILFPKKFALRYSDDFFSGCTFRLMGKITLIKSKFSGWSNYKLFHAII